MQDLASYDGSENFSRKVIFYGESSPKKLDLTESWRSLRELN
jgi:hypothetical protein